MKKTILSLLILALLMPVAMAALEMPAAAAQSVTVSGNDLTAALNNVADGGTITISGTCTVASGFAWPSYTKDVTITGGTLNLTAMGSTVNFNGNVTFENMTLTMMANATVYANGHRLTVKENVIVTNSVSVIYGGGAKDTTVASTHLTLLAGSYNNIFGGSNGGTVTGDTNVTVGGMVNPKADYKNHSGIYNVYGGGNADTIGGNTHMTFTGNAMANYIFGGSKGEATIKGNKYATMSGGKTMSFYGGNSSHDTGAGNNYTVMSGGTLEQLFGGNQAAPMTGNVDLRVMGGTVERRIYGGCYNEATSGGFLDLQVIWTTEHYVTGNIQLVIGSNANIPLNCKNSSGTTYDDLSIYAVSRRKASSAEVASLIFADTAAATAYKGKLGAQDTKGAYMMAGVSAYDTLHTHTQAQTADNTITETCDNCSHSQQATLSVAENAYTYTGSPITPAIVTYSDGWLGYRPDTITYTDNINAGTAVASLTYDSLSLSATFTIEKAAQSAPAVSGVAETVKGKADGRISALSTEMEYSTNGTTYAAVTDTEMELAAGTYYVRLAETDNYTASPATTVTVAAGRLLTVTFVADSVTVDTREVVWSGTVTDLPAIPTKMGYDNTAPYWEQTYTNVQADLTVHAVYTPNTYTVTFKADGTTIDTISVSHGATIQNPPAVPEKTGFDGAWESTISDPVVGDMTINAVYSLKQCTVTFLADGETVDTYKVTYGAALEAVPAVPAKTGHTGVWNISDLTNITDDITVTAVYTPIDCTVTFKADGVTVGTIVVKYGETVTNAPAIPAKAGYTDTAPYWSGNLSCVTTNTVINAHYTPNRYTITFVADGKTVTTRQVNHDAVLASIPAIPTKEGHSGAWDITDFDGFTADTTVTAIYTPNTYTVTFVAGGATVTTREVVFGNSLTDIPAVPARAGYTGAWDTANFDTVTGDMTVTAVYTMKIYTVTFTVDGRIVASRNVLHGAALTNVPTIPTKAGYTDVAPVWDVTDFSEITDNLTVKALYTANTYTVTFVADGVTICAITVSHGEGITAPEVPEKADHTGAWNKANFDTVTGDMTVTAVYTAISAEPESDQDTTDNNRNAGLEDAPDTAPDSTDKGSNGAVVIIVIAVAVCAAVGTTVAIILIHRKKKA